MKKILLTLIVITGISISSVFAEQASFVKGQRHANDIARDKTSMPQQIIAFAGVKKGMVIGDIFGGGGYYSELLGEVVGKTGKIYLHNNQAYMKYVEKQLIARLKNNRLDNVIRYDREADNLDFKKESLDEIFFVLGFHDLYHIADGWNVPAKPFIKQLHESLKNGGKLLIIDHSAIVNSGKKYAQNLHRIDAEFVKKTLLANGFKFLKQSNILANKNDTRMMVVFDKAIRRKTDRFVMLFEKI